MAHEIKENDVFGETRTGGKRAWHGLGDEIPEGLTAEDAFRQVGLDWETELCPVYARVGKDLETSIAIEGHYAHVRAKTNAVLGIVTSAYKPFENMDLAKLADSLVEAGAEKEDIVTVETCGSLYGNRRIYVLVKLPTVIRAAKGDDVETFVCVSNGHGGFAALSAYPTSVRVVCANTLRWSERSLALGGTWRHVGDFEGKVKQARQVLGLAFEETKKFEEKVRALVAKNWDVSKTRKYMERAYEECFGKIDMEGDGPTVEKLLAKRADVMAHWLRNLEEARNQIAGIRGTAWAAYNAVSQWHDHERGRFQSVHQSDARVHSNLFGASQNSKLRAFRAALATA